MINGFAHKGLASFFYAGRKKGIQQDHAQRLADVLDQLDAAQTVDDMKYPGSNLHRLKGKFKGFWSVRISGNWRVVFRFQSGDALDVNYLDYH